jgi:hypothetical protein
MTPAMIGLTGARRELAADELDLAPASAVLMG